MKNTVVCHLTSVHAYNDTRIFHKECVTLAQAGYDVYLIAPVDNAFREKGVNVVPAGSWGSRYYRLFVTVPRLLVKALKMKASVYHLHDPELLLITPFFLLSGASVVYDIHEDYVTSIRQKSYMPSMFRKIASSILNRLERSTSARCYQIIAERYYKERFPDALEILNYPLLPEQGNEFTKKLLPDHEVVFDNQYIWCLYTGNVTVDRGALLHLNLLSAQKDTAIAYIGKCSEIVAQSILSHAKALNINSDRIKMIGVESHVPRETIDYYTYSKRWLAGVALFPNTPHYTRKELTKFFEYMAAGLPILSSDFPVWKNIIEKNDCGFCVDPANLQSIEFAVNSLLDNDGNEAETMGRNGREAVYERYNWNIEEKKLLDLYRGFRERK